MQPVQPVPAPIIIRAAYDPIPNGTKIEMGFHDSKSGELRYYEATVRGSTVMMVGAVGGMPKAVATARAYTANCEQRLVAMLSFSHEDSSLMMEAVLSFWPR